MSAAPPPAAAPSAELRRLQRKLYAAVVRAVEAYAMIRDGDRVVVGVSGGKDSFALAKLLVHMQRKGVRRFALQAVHLDGGFGVDAAAIVTQTEALGLPCALRREDVLGTVRRNTPPGDSPCSMCAKLRRGLLYRATLELGANKLALGHHRRDVLCTLLLNLVYAGKLAAMPPVLRSDDGQVELIRPLIACEEAALARFAEFSGFVRGSARCPLEPDGARSAMARVLGTLVALQPNAEASMLAALANVEPRHLHDPELWRALGLDLAHGLPEPRK